MTIDEVRLTRAELSPWSNPPLRHVPITGDRYTSPEFMAREWEHIWTKVWLLLGRAVEIPEPGDYQMEEIGRESFIMIRQDDGSIRAFYNVCQHRGSRIVFQHEGHARNLICPYHGWEWGRAGDLRVVRDADDFPDGDPCGQLELVEVRCDIHAGFIFVTMNDDAPSLREYLGPMWDEWAAYRCDDWERTSAATVNMSCNWKVPQDNSCESYHLPTVHPQGRWWIEDDPADTFFDWCDEGHNRMAMKMATPARRMEPEEVRVDEQLAAMIEPWGLRAEDFEGREYEIREEVQRAKRRLGPERGYRVEQLTDDQLTDAYHYNVFPNVTISFAGCEYVGLQRMRPHRTDPERHHYDNFTYAAKGSETDTELAALGGKEWLTEGAERQVFDYGERLMNRRIADQDLSIVTGQQLGLASRAYTGVHLPTQEHRIQNFHDVIDDYLTGRR